jgi:hypothetical protein
MTNLDLTREAFEHLFGVETAALDLDAAATLKKHAVPPFKAAYEFEGKSGRAMSPVWVVAKAGAVVLGYDEVEEEYGIGTLLASGLLTGWGTFGERLHWSLIRFPDPTQVVS